jgi:hypothetical protein
MVFRERNGFKKTQGKYLMAGIEKVCEFSDEYPGHLMYDYKRNLIQIMPKYRKLFRGADHVLVIFKPSKVWVYSDGLSSDYDPDDWKNWEPPFKSEEEYFEWYKGGQKCRLINEYTYMLKVTDPKLAGNVNGEYLNYSHELSTVKRKIKRMLRRDLNIVKLDMSYPEFSANNRSIDSPVNIADLLSNKGISIDV